MRPSHNLKLTNNKHTLASGKLETGKRIMSAFRLRILMAVMMPLLTVAVRAYSPPPNWDPMLMLNVTLNASNQLAVETTTYICPLTVAPGAYDATNQTYNLAVVSFDPAQPWTVLNGTAYSRELGWYDSVNDDFYTTYATQISTNYVWIERVSGSPELKIYTVAEAQNPTGPYTPIFGTAGSSSKWLWDGFMDHNANAVPLANLNSANQLFTATYHLYVGDVNGRPAPGYGDTTTTWNWRGPALAVVPMPTMAWSNSEIAISWTTTVTNLVLIAADALPGTNWVTVTNPPVFAGGQATVRLQPSSAGKFFRLQLLL